MPDQPETDDRHDTIVVQGDDADHVLPPQELDPFTPETALPARGRIALWIALLAIVAVLVIVIAYAVTR
jgi:hypothetical protein